MDVDKQLPLLGRDCMSLLQFDVVNLLELVTHYQIHHTSVDTMTNKIMTEFADVFKDELGVLKGIEAVVTVQESTSP